MDRITDQEVTAFRIRVGALAALFVIVGVWVNVARGQPQERVFNTPEERAAWIQANPGREFVNFERTIDQAASGTGAGLDTKGQDQKTDFTSTAPAANLPGIGGASGGDSDITASNKGAANLWSNPLLWAGLLCVLGAGVAVYLREFRAATIAGATGGVLIVVALFPAILLWAIAIGGAALIAWYLWREHQASQDAKAKAKAEADAKANKEAARAMAGGIAALETADPQAYEKVKAEVGKQADPQDVAVIAKIKEEDRL